MFLCAGAQVASYMITLADLPSRPHRMARHRSSTARAC